MFMSLAKFTCKFNKQICFFVCFILMEASMYHIAYMLTRYSPACQRLYNISIVQ